MIDENIYRTTLWDKDLGEDFETVKKEILFILKEQKVSLSKIRCLFNVILREIEDNNPITLPLEKQEYNMCVHAVESKNLAKPSECH